MLKFLFINQARPFRKLPPKLFNNAIGMRASIFKPQTLVLCWIRVQAAFTERRWKLQIAKRFTGLGPWLNAWILDLIRILRIARALV